LDDKDKLILDILQNNYKISYKEISDKANLAASTIHNRVQNLISEGIIKKVDTVIDPLKVGFKAIAIVSLHADPLKLKEIAEELLKYDEIQLVATSSGDHNLILKLILPDEKNLWRFINEKIKSVNGVNPDIKVSSFIDIYKMTQKIRLL
ncbi:MAG: Lrp/AsnC family transcriptional regulator, partial [Candidatus Hermodarchaeota archaeon]